MIREAIVIVLRWVDRVLFGTRRVYSQQQYSPETRKYSADIISTDANADFMLDPKFIEAYEACESADQGRLLCNNNYDIRWRCATSATSGHKGLVFSL